MIGIIDYGAGNLDSVKKIFDHIGAKNTIISSSREFKKIRKLVFPGVGAYGPAMKMLRFSGLYDKIADWLEANRPFLGICLGMQLLFESSPEAKNTKGFGFFKGHCQRFRAYKVPQIGWNQISFKKRTALLTGIKDDAFFYFLHSYYLMPEDRDIITARTSYGVEYTSIITAGNIYAVQFHPEKSGRAGIKLLKNWVEKC